MKVTLLHNTPLYINAVGARACWDSHGKSDTGLFTEICGEGDKALIDRVGNKFKHQSILEHVSYNFYIEGISRACLQELARHRMASLSVKSTRYTLKELKEEKDIDYVMLKQPEFDLYNSNEWKIGKKYLVSVDNYYVDLASIKALSNLQEILKDGVSNDIAKYCLPESYKTELTWTINMRSLQNFLSLRSDKSALWEIRNLANAIYESLPEEHKYMYNGYMKIEKVKHEDFKTFTLTEEIKKEYRTEFGLDGAFDSDEQIKRWWILKQSTEFTRHM